MNNLKESKKSSFKTYLIVMSLFLVAVVLIMNLMVLPKIIKILAETSSIQTEVIKQRFFNITTGSLIFIFLMNFYFLKIEKQLDQEEKEAQNIIKIDLNNPTAQEKLKLIEKKRNRYASLLDPIFRIIIGLTIGLITYTLLTPIYSLMGTF